MRRLGVRCVLKVPASPLLCGGPEGEGGRKLDGELVPAVAAIVGNHEDAGRLPYAYGLMFWFNWKKLVGSYLVLSCTSRS